MKKVLALMAISALFTGCASTTSKPVDPYEVARQKYAPWQPTSIASIDGTVYLAEPSSKKQVAPGVYKIWTKDTKDLDTITLEVIDCNTQETATSQMVMINKQGKVLDPIKINTLFRKPTVGTVGYGIIEYICK